MNEIVSFGQVVKERRLARGMTQVELARRSRCAPITIRKIESNDLRPSVQLAELIALALDVPETHRVAFVQMARQEPRPSPIPHPAPTLAEIGESDLSGRAIRGLELGKRIGSSEFGVVYRARQPSVNRVAAVKIILPRVANQPEFVRGFDTAVPRIARLESPHIVPLYDFWREPEAAYLVMRYLHGGSLEDRLKAGPLHLADFQLMVYQLAMAFDAAHRQQVVHCNIKPTNVLLDDDANAYLADFGSAKLTHLNGLQAGEEGDPLIGSPAYVSPEQILSEPVRAVSDIYCFGILMYEMLTGQPPFKGPTTKAYLSQHLEEPLPLLEEAGGTFPPRLDVVLQRATAKRPRERYGSVTELLDELTDAT